MRHALEDVDAVGEALMDLRREFDEFLAVVFPGGNGELADLLSSSGIKAERRGNVRNLFFWNFHAEGNQAGLVDADVYGSHGDSVMYCNYIRSSDRVKPKMKILLFLRRS